MRAAGGRRDLGLCCGVRAGWFGGDVHPTVGVGPDSRSARLSQKRCRELVTCSGGNGCLLLSELSKSKFLSCI